MSDPTQSARGSEEDTISKFMKRMKTVVKRGSRSNRNSIASMSEMTGEPSKSSSSKKPTENPTVVRRKTPEPAPMGHWSNSQQEKARALFAKYGLTLEPEEWMSNPRPNWTAERVEKPIRMRVRRNCHRCQTTFGADKLCSNCQHPRCTKCPRYPVAKTPEEKEVRAKAKAAAAAKEARKAGRPSNPPLTIPSRTGGQDLVRKPIMQRVRRTCHQCETMFNGDAKECASCHHIRCKKCPRDPPKLHKYPDGYPGDVDPPPEKPMRVWQKPRRRVRWNCHECSKLFSEGKRTCPQCSHERCQDCTRDPPKKVKPEPDPELVKRVEEKLAKLDLGT